MGRAQPGEGRNEIYPAIIRNGIGQSFGLPCIVDQFELVLEPTDGRGRIVDDALQSVCGTSLMDPGNRRDGFAVCRTPPVTQVEHDRTSRSERGFDRPRIVAPLCEQRCLGVSHDPGDGNRLFQKALQRRLAEDRSALPDFGQSRSGYLEQRTQLIVPIESIDVEEKGS